MSGIISTFLREIRRMVEFGPAFMVLIVAIAIYAVYYPQPYLNEALRKIPIAVVDQDGTSSSREFARLVHATPDVAVAEVLPDLATAERAVFARRIYGILLIPRDFERYLLHGRPSPVALYADASYFLMYQRMSAGVTAVAKTYGADVEARRLIAIGVDPAIAAAAADPMPLTVVALFNPQAGYATYLLPAAFVLILQQTLLIGVGLLGTLPGARRPTAAAGPVETVIGKLLAYLALEALVLPFYLIVLPYFYGIPRLGPVTAILIFAVPFVFAVGALGMVVAGLFRSPLLVQLICAAIGLPFFFLAGFSWPVSAIPPAVRLLSTLVPTTSAIDGIVRIAQMGAPLADVRSQFLTLWVLTACYAGIAVLLEVRSRRAEARRAALRAA